MQQTLAIIKPDAVLGRSIGTVVMVWEQDYIIFNMKMAWLTKGQAEEFYKEHLGKPFFDNLVAFMISGPIVVAILEGADVITKWRERMGATNSAEAEPYTVRAVLGDKKVLHRNAVHGSDSTESAIREIALLF